MSAQTELKSWLNRPNVNFLSNLSFGIKVWNSIEFTMLSKYEIITEFFCDNLGKLERELDTEITLEKAWENVIQFLSLTYPLGAISHATKAKLVKSILNETKIEPSKELSRKFFEALLCLLQHPLMINFYNTNLKLYTKLFARATMYYLELITRKDNEPFNTEQEKETVKQLIDNVRDFSQQASKSDNYKNLFRCHVMTPLTELYILLKSKNIDFEKDLFGVLQILYFNPESIDYFKKYFDNYPNDLLEDEEAFKFERLDLHIQLIMIEGFMVAYQSEKELSTKFLEFLFGKFFITSTNKYNLEHIFIGLNVLLHLLKKYNVRLNVEIKDDQTLSDFMGQKIMLIVHQFANCNTYEILEVICNSLILNPMILEYYIVEIIGIFMLQRKDEKSLQKYGEFMCLVIDVFQKLSRAEKMINKMLECIKTELNRIKLSRKLKRKLEKENNDLSTTSMKRMKIDEVINISVTDDQDALKHDFIKILQSLYKTDKLSAEKMGEILTWTDVTFAWPASVSARFSKFVSSLMSNTSLVVWKTLIFAVSDSMSLLKNRNYDENSLFFTEFTTSLLCQYLNGCRLVEQADKNWQQIQDRRNLVQNILKEFGEMLLHMEHNTRLMNIFLQLCLFAGNFDLMCGYYCPDSINTNENDKQYPNLPIIDLVKYAKNTNDYLSADEWILIEQRIINFGRDECKNNLNKLHLQRIKSMLLLSTDATEKGHKSIVKATLLVTILSDYNQLEPILMDTITNLWFIQLLNRQQKITAAECILNEENFPNLNVNEKHFCNIFEDAEFLEIFVICIYKIITSKINSKKAGISALEFDGIINAGSGEDLFAKALQKIESRSTNVGCIKNLPIDDLIKLFTILSQLPIAYMSSNVKSLIFSINLILYADLDASQQSNLKLRVLPLLSIMSELGATFECFNNISLDKIINGFPNVEENQKFYSIIFENISNYPTEIKLKNVGKLLKAFKSDEKNKNFELLLLLAQYFVNVKKYHKIENNTNQLRTSLSELIFQRVDEFFIDEHEEQEKIKFIGTTMVGFGAALYMHFHMKENHTKANEKLGNLCKIYVTTKIDCNKDSLLRIITTVTHHLDILKIAKNDIMPIIYQYWMQLKSNLQIFVQEKSVDANMKKLLKLYKDFANVVSTNYSDEEYLKMMDEIKETANDNSPKFVCKLLEILAGADLTKNKGIIFSEYFKHIIYSIILKMKLSENVNEHYLAIMDIFGCYKVVTENVNVHMSDSLFQDILSFMLEINIKKFKVNDSNNVEFMTLHSEMILLCNAIVQYRLISLRHVMPQFVSIFKDLIHTICAYRNDSQEKIKLAQVDITILTSLAHKLELMIEALASRKKYARKVAPFMLVFVINEMIFNQNSTTIYPTIKNHIYKICYHLIAICDPNYGQFILRGCSEASRDVYKTLLKDYDKYYKFHGKV